MSWTAIADERRVYMLTQADSLIQIFNTISIPYLYLKTNKLKNQ